jgi:hypothetical protein
MQNGIQGRWPVGSHHQAPLYIVGWTRKAEEDRVRQLASARAQQGRRAAGCDAPPHSGQIPDGRRSRRAQAALGLKCKAGSQLLQR